MKPSNPVIRKISFFFLFFLVIFSLKYSQQVDKTSALVYNNTPDFEFSVGGFTQNGEFNYPYGVFVDDNSNVYVADTRNHRIQKFTTTGTFVSKWGTFGVGNGQFKEPTDIVVDSLGKVYVCDRGNHRIQKFNPDGTYITQWGGLGTGDGQLDYPWGIGVDTSNNIYVAEYNNNRIQKFTNTGSYITKWGTVGTGDGQFTNPIDIAIDSSGNSYVVEYTNARVQKFDSNNNYLQKWGSSGTSDGQFRNPHYVALDSSNNVYVVDYSNSRIQKFTNTGAFTTKWGTSGLGDGQFRSPVGVAVDNLDRIYIGGYLDQRVQVFTNTGTFITKWGSIADANGKFVMPEGMTIGADGSIYVTDSGNHRIQKFNKYGAFLTSWGTRGSGDGQFISPDGIAIDSSENIYVADRSNNRVQKFNSSGTFITKWGTLGSGDGQFSAPVGIYVDSADNVYVAEINNDRIQKFNSSGTFITKWGSVGSGDGQFNNPWDIASDSVGNIYILDTYNNRVQKFTNTGTFISKWGSNGSGDGQFNYPYGLVIDSGDNIIISDLGNYRIQKFTNDGTFIWKYGVWGNSANGFYSPYKLALDKDESIYLADLMNSRFLKLNQTAGQVANLQASLNVTDTDGNNIEIGSPNGIRSGTVYLKQGSTMISAINISPGLNDVNWSGVSGEVDLGGGRSVVSGLTSAPGASSTHTLYIPRLTGHQQVRICPDAVVLTDVTEVCSNGVTFGPGESKIVNGVSVMVQPVNVGGIDYWKASGVNGTGGISLFGVYALRDTLTRLQGGVASNHTIDFGTVNGLLSSGDTISIEFDPTGQNWDLSSITLSDIDLLDDGSQLTLGTTPGVGVWGVNINSSTDTIVFTTPTSGSGYIGGGSSIQVLIGTNATGGSNQIINPGVVNEYEIHITNTNPTDPETGEISIPIIDDDTVNVTGYIDTFIAFDLDTTTDLIASTRTQCDATFGINPCDSHGGASDNSGYTIDLGEMSVAMVNNGGDNVMHQDGLNGTINTIGIDLESNAVGGTVVTVVSLNEGLKGPGANSIPSVIGGPTSITAGSGLYGIREIDSIAISGTINIIGAYNGVAGSFGTVIDGGTPIQILNSNSGIIEAGRSIFEIGASPDSMDGTGTYIDQLTFIATATF